MPSNTWLALIFPEVFIVPTVNVSVIEASLLITKPSPVIIPLELILPEDVIGEDNVIGCWNVIESPTVIGEFPCKWLNEPVNPVTVPLELMSPEAVILLNITLLPVTAKFNMFWSPVFVPLRLEPIIVPLELISPDAVILLNITLLPVMAKFNMF